MRERGLVLAACFGVEGVGLGGYGGRGGDGGGWGEVLGFRRAPPGGGGERNRVVWGWGLDPCGFCLDFDWRMGLEKVRVAGFVEVEQVEEWVGAVDGFKRAGMMVG